MALVSAVQPSFFEGQYLGADDLAAIVEYFRIGLARHALSAHEWGVTAGLDLVGSEIAPGEFQASVMPGVAIDGYGRLIVVTTPTEVPTSKLQGIDTGPVKVWIRYAQRPIRGARPGFNTCGDEDAFARIEETFEIEVGERPGILDRQSGVSIAGAIVNDAREAARATNPDAPLHCDASVPYQEFPIDDDDSIWLVPLGVVSWNSISNSFGELTDDQRPADRIFRRHFGAVAEDILAANGIIRLRDRATEFEADINAACAKSASVASDYTVCDSVLSAREMIWLEGDTRLTGDLRIFGTRLEFRDGDGKDYVPRTSGGVPVEAIGPMMIERAANTRNGEDLRVIIGAGADGPNRFAVGPATVSGTTICDQDVTGLPHFVVQQDGKVGVGTAQAPDSELIAPLTVRGLDGTTPVTDPVTGLTADEPIWHLLHFEDVGGNAQWEIDLWRDGESLSFHRSGATPGALYLDTSGNVGIDNTAPEARLEVSGTPVGASAGLGNNLWFRLGDGGQDGDAGRVWVEYGEQNAPLMVLSDHDDPPRLQFQQTGNGGDEFNPDHATWIGHIDGSSEDFGIIGGGQIGLGTEQPYTDVTIDGSLGFKSGTAPLVYFFESDVNNPDRMVLSHSPAFNAWGLKYQDVGDRFVFQSSDIAPTLTADLSQRRVGVGTDAPSEALDVRGSIKLGDSGELFAVGTGPDMRMIAGEVNANGTLSRGQGFAPNRTAEGRYTITFAPSFAATPFVTATGINNRDNLVSVTSVSSNSVSIRCFDTLSGDGEDSGDHDTAFMFIVLGQR